MGQSLAQAYSSSEMGANKKKRELSPREVVKHIFDACDDAKGKDIVVLDVSKNFGLADYFVIASGRSDRHSQGIANKIIDELASLGIEPYSLQGMEDGKWVVLDCIEIVVHIFYEPLRERYDLESLWTDAQTVERKALSSKRREGKQEKVPVLA